MRPGTLFAELWTKVEPDEAAVLLRPWKGRKAKEYKPLLRLLEKATERDVPPEILDYLGGQPLAFKCEVNVPEERAFVVMCAIDEAVMNIHPATKTRRPGRASAVGNMLALMRMERTMNGSYGEMPGRGLVLPKGPLMPGKVRANAKGESGTSLSHHFSYLSFVPLPGKHFTLRPLALPPSRLSVTAEAAGRVGLAPIAVDRHDLEFSTSERGNRPFLDTVPKEAGLAKRVETEVSALLDKGAGLIVLPELVTSRVAASGLAESLQKTGRAHNAMILVGSGPTDEICGTIGRPFNEAVVMTSSGDELFRQRKLNTFNMRWQRMEECALPRADHHKKHPHMEDCATGQELVICDIHGLGRVMVLICEDLEQQAPGGDVCLNSLPDWVLTPVLDVGLAFGRWEHRRAIEIGRRTGSRFVVSCSAILQVRSFGKDKLSDTVPDAVTTGFCLDGAVELRATHVGTGGPDPRHHMIVEWKPASWKKHKVVED